MLSCVGAYMKISERRVAVREAARHMLRTGTTFQDLNLRGVAEELGWSLGTLHRAYSITSTLLNDLLLEFEDDTYGAVYLTGHEGLEVELSKQAHRMYEHLADESHVQMLRYQMTLGCRSENPLELQLRNSRDSSWEFTRDILIQIGQAAAEEYNDLDALTSIVTASRDGLAYQLFTHHDRQMWLRDSLNAAKAAVQFAQPRAMKPRPDGMWAPDQLGPRRPDNVHRPAGARRARH
jgi:hypothetical protein